MVLTCHRALSPAGVGAVVPARVEALTHRSCLDHRLWEKCPKTGGKQMLLLSSRRAK